MRLKRIIPAAFAHLEVAFLHVYLLLQLSSCSKNRPQLGGREVDNSNSYCPRYSLHAGIVFPEPPGHRSPDFGHEKTAIFRGAVLPACWSCQAPRKSLLVFGCSRQAVERLTFGSNRPAKAARLLRYFQLQRAAFTVG